MTPVEELFRLLWDTPKDKFTWFTIRKQIMEKEKEVIVNAYIDGLGLEPYEVYSKQQAEQYYNEKFNNEKF
jgi:HEPN domain-containing protein